MGYSGGAWNNNNPHNLRAAYFNRNNADNRNNNLGFRLARFRPQHSPKTSERES